MPQHQLIGIVLLGVAVADTLLGLLVVVPRVPDEAKRVMLRTVFASSGLLLAGLGYCFYRGLLGT